jgi:pilus assembly protein CpaB
MNRTRLMLIGVVALALGLFVSTLVFKNLQNKTGDRGEQLYAAIVAANDLQVGAKVTDRDIKIIKVSASDLPAGAPRKKADVLDHGVIIPITKGDFILPSKLAGDNAGSGLPSLIPPGMRAVAVRVNDVVSVAGFVTAGSRVDVLLTGTPGANGEEQTTTVLQNVAVLAAGHTLERTATGEAQNTPVITLLVSPDDAQRLTLATTQGHIQLSLRNPLDTKAQDVAVSGAHALYKGGVAPPTQTAPVHRTIIRKPETTAPPPQAPTSFSVEVYQGDTKPKTVNCTEDGCNDSK